MALTDKVLPIGLAALGTGYYAWTMLQKPKDPRALALWDRHKSDARIALFAGLGAAGLLLIFHGVSGDADMERDSFA